MLYIETSAKTGVGVSEAFITLASTIYTENHLENMDNWNPDQIREWESKGIRIGTATGLTISDLNSSNSSNLSCCKV